MKNIDFTDFFNVFLSGATIRQLLFYAEKLPFVRKNGRYFPPFRRLKPDCRAVHEPDHIRKRGDAALVCRLAAERQKHRARVALYTAQAAVVPCRRNRMANRALHCADRRTVLQSNPRVDRFGNLPYLRRIE